MLRGFLFFRANEFNPLDAGRKLNVHLTFRRCLGRPPNVFCTLNLRPKTGRKTKKFKQTFNSGISFRALKTLLVLDLDTLMSELVSLRYQYELDQLIRAIISCACKHIAENDKVVTLLKQIIDEFDLKDGQIVLLIRYGIF